MVKLFRALLQFGLAEAFAACFYGVPVVSFQSGTFPSNYTIKMIKIMLMEIVSALLTTLFILFLDR
jgi:hypothetical protein